MRKLRIANAHEMRRIVDTVGVGFDDRRYGVVLDALSFERDIRPLFRPEDVDAMSFAFDLSSYDDVRANAEAIFGRLADGSMPCDARWPVDQIERFRRWIDAGTPG